MTAIFNPLGFWHHPAQPGFIADDGMEFPHDFIVELIDLSDQVDGAYLWALVPEPCPPDCAYPVCAARPTRASLFMYVPAMHPTIVMQAPFVPEWTPTECFEHAQELDMDEPGLNGARACIVRGLTEAGYVHFSGKELTA